MDPPAPCNALRVLKPVQVPATPERWGWERLAAYLVAREMETQSLPPHLAAEQAIAQLENAWRVKFPGRDLPLELMPPSASTEDLPGGIKAGESLTWAIVAAPTPDGEYLTTEEIAGLVGSYDPEFRRAPIVLPSGKGPTHDVGEWAPWVPGTVRALASDGWFLWALIEDRQGMLGFEVDFAGIRDRSIRWWPELDDLDPPAPYLRHIALLSAEPPGVPNMPGLDQYFLAERPADSKQLTVREATLKNIPTREVTMETDPKKVAPATDPPGGKDAKELSEPKEAKVQESDVPDQGVDLAQLTKDAAEAVVKELTARGVIKPAEPDPKPKTEPSETERQLAAATATIATLGDQIRELSGKVETLSASSTTSALAARKARVTETLDRAVSEGRLTAGHRELEEPLLCDARLTDVEVSDRLTKIAALPRSINPEIVASLSYEDGEGTARDVPSRLLPPAGYGANSGEIERTARALSRVTPTGDAQKDYEAKRAAIYAECN